MNTICNTMRTMREFNELELILKYKMDDLEAKSFKLCLIWEELCEKEFPKEKFIKLRKNSDPRKSNLFKYCYKLIKETKGILKDNEYKLYILAQLQILKCIKDGKVHALIDPQILVGDKAWKRWKLWRYKYNKKISAYLSSEDLSIKTKQSKVELEISNTFNFLQKQSDINLENLKRWASNGSVSYFYIILSPLVNKLSKNIISDFNFDFIYYRSSINPEIESFFKEKFKHEYQ